MLRYLTQGPKAKKWVKIDPPLKVTAALLNLKNWRFPEVVGIVGAPIMRPDGSILSELGYDVETRLWCNCDIELPPIPEKPTATSRRRRFSCCKDLLSGFPFVSAVYRAVALAALLSAVLRGHSICCH